MKARTIYIAFLGIDERSRSAYEIFFKQIKPINCILTNDYYQAQICLVDMDAYNIQQNYKLLIDKHPDLKMLLLSLTFNKYHPNNEFFIPKPVKRNVLEKVIYQICQQLFQIPVLRQPESRTTPNPIESTHLINKTPGPCTSPSKKPTQEKKSNIIPFKVKSQNHKPHSVASAARLLNVKNDEHFVGKQKDININDPEQLKTIFYSPEQCLQNIVKQACIQSEQSGQIIQINFLNHELYFDHEERIVYSTAGPGIIRPLCLLTVDKKIQFIPKPASFRDELHETNQNNNNKNFKKPLIKQSWNMEAFMWLISLWTSRGRIPEGTEILKPVFLTQWPNLTRLASIPHSVRIAALLYDQPYPLVEAAQVLGINQRYVFAFYTACKSIGLANISRRQVNHLFAGGKQETNKNKSILSKLFNKLKHFSDKSVINEIA